MQDIESIAIQNYKDNMAFFKEKHPALHNKLLALDTILNDGSYPQKYDLEYKDGYFDIIELNSKTYLYNQDSDKLSQELVDKITYKKNEHTFKSFRKTNFDANTKDYLKTKSAYTSFSTIAEIMDYYYKNTDDSMSMEKIDKFIFLGTGLGVHIAKAIKKFNLQVILIVEDDIELFRLSLFTTNYKKALEKCIAHFSVAQNSTEFSNTFNSFFTQAFFKNQYIKFNIFSSSYEEKIQEIRSLLITRPEATYTHDRLLLKNKMVIDKIIKNYKFLNVLKHSEEKFFKDKPWLVVGAGPSLHHNAQWLIENQDKFIIITVFSALNTLKKLGVKPDIITHIDEDPNNYTTKMLLDTIGDLSFLDESIVFLSASVMNLLFDQFDKERVYLHEDRTKYKMVSSTLQIGSVGETVYSMALIFNASNIYMLGLDLALSDEGHTHSPDHILPQNIQDKKDISFDDDKVEDFSLRDSTINIKGNFRNIVKTTPLFAFSIPILNGKTKTLKTKEQTVYNLSDGAYFENTIPLKVEDVKTQNNIDKKNIFKELKELFDKYSTTELEGKELDALKCRKAQIDDYYVILETFKNSPQSNSEIFMASYIRFATDLLSHKCKFELHDILTIYFLKIASYIDDFLYTKEITNKKKHIKKFKSFLVTQVEKILKTFEEDLLLIYNKIEE